MPTIELLLLSLSVGLMIGSFLNVVIYRYPLMLNQQWRQECQQYLGQTTEKNTTLNLAIPRSHCPHCQTLIKIIHNIPVFSFLLLRGKCASCHQKISIQYPTVELLTGILSLLVVYQYGMTWTALAALFLTWNLICLTFIDLKHQLLPDNMTLSVLWIGLFINLGSVFTTPHDAILGAIVGYLLLWMIAKLFFILRKKEGMGYGDFKMLAMLGAWLGVSMIINIILSAVLLGSVIGIALMLSHKATKDVAIPFGPFLAFTGWLTLMYGPFLMQCIERWIL